MTVLDSVEVYNCSQYDTLKAAIRFEANFAAASTISYSAIHHGLGIAMQFTAGNNVKVSNNAIFSFVKYGINVASSSNININGNIVASINSRNIGGLDGAIDLEAGILGCALFEGDYCPGLLI